MKMSQSLLSYRSVDVVVRLELLLVDHVLVVTKLVPLLLILHVHDLCPLIFLLLHHIHPLLVILVPLSNLLCSLILHHLLLLLALHHDGVRLHV